MHPFGRWRKLKSGVWRRCCRDFDVFSSSQCTETVLPRPVTTPDAESVNRCTAVEFSLLHSRPKRPNFGGFRSPPTATRRSCEVGGWPQRLGSAPWHLESMKHTSRDVRQRNWVLQCREHGQLYRHRCTHLGGGGSWSLVFHAGVAGIFACFRAHSAWKPYYPGL